MLALDAESHHPFTSFQSSAGKFQHKENFLIVQSNAAVPSVTLYRLASIAGLGSALILLVNAAKRSSLIPTSDLTQLLAPFAEVLALGARAIAITGDVADVSCHEMLLDSAEAAVGPGRCRCSAGFSTPWGCE